MCLMPSAPSPAPVAPQYQNPPTKTDSDVAQAAEDQRRKMALSTQGFGADYRRPRQRTSANGGANNYGGVEPPPLQSVVLGS